MNTAQMPRSASASVTEREYNLERIPELVEQLFRERQGTATAAPLVKSNLLETWQSFWLQVAVPGIDLATLQVQAIGRRVQLTGRFNAQVIETATYLRQELPIGEFAETFELPEEVEGQHAEAHFDGGLLTVRLPKLSYLSPATIPVHCP